MDKIAKLICRFHANACYIKDFLKWLFSERAKKQIVMWPSYKVQKKEYFMNFTLTRKHKGSVEKLYKSVIPLEQEKDLLQTIFILNIAFWQTYNISN